LIVMMSTWPSCCTSMSVVMEAPQEAVGASAPGLYTRPVAVERNARIRSAACRTR